MLKRFLCLSLVLTIMFSGMTFAKDKSTNTTKSYFKTQKKLNKLEKRKKKATNNIKFLKHRLEVQEQKLEVYTSDDNNKKGEKE